MSRQRLSASVRDFIQRHAGTIEQLETLLLLRRAENRSWSAREIADELQFGIGRAEEILEGFGRENFVDVKVSADVFYRFNPGTPALRKQVDQVADASQRNRIEVIKLVTAGETDPLRDFADAFRIRGFRKGED